MDIQLQELIDKIKKEGISKAEEDAKATIDAAEKKAEQIIADANAKAEEILKNAKAEIKSVEKASEEAIVQAGRNMLLSFKDGIINLSINISVENLRIFAKYVAEEYLKRFFKKC